MAEEGVFQSGGDPMMGVGAGSKSYFLPVSRNYQSLPAGTSGNAALLKSAASGAAGDYLEGLLLIPTTTSMGGVTLTDGGGSAITVFTGGQGSLSNLQPFYLPVKARSTSGAWSVTTSTNGAVLAGGSFT